MSSTFRAKLCGAVAKGLSEDYPGTTPQIIEECLTAYLEGKRGADMPHGIIGRFAEANFDGISVEGLKALKVRDWCLK